MFNNSSERNYACAAACLFMIIILTVLFAIVLNQPPATAQCVNSNSNFSLGVEYREPDEYIGVVFVSCPTESQFEAVQLAASKWSTIIKENPGVMGQGSIFQQTARSLCGFLDNDLSISNELVFDHLVVYIDLTVVDGRGGVLGEAGPCLYADGFPVVGGIVLDDADLRVLKPNTLLTLITHEMGHTLGYGLQWEEENLVRDLIFPSSNEIRVENFPIYIGSNALAMYNELLTSPTDGVPLEDGRANGEFAHFRPDIDDSSGRGSIDMHWKREVFGEELMVYAIRNNDVLYPLSKVTVGSIEDLGYQVDYTAADDFELLAESTSDSSELFIFDNLQSVRKRTSKTFGFKLL